jgi:hypothetical protein
MSLNNYEVAYPRVFHWVFRSMFEHPFGCDRMVKRQKSGRFSFKEERWLLEMASKLTVEAAAARLKPPVPTIRRKALEMGIILKEGGRKKKT